MQFHYESSSLVTSSADLLYGKFFPPENYRKCYKCMPTPIGSKEKLEIVNGNALSIIENKCDNEHVNIFAEVYGIFGNLTKRFAVRMDDFEILCEPNCHIAENYLLNRFAIDTLVAISEEPDFWSGVPKYPWFWHLFGELYKMSKSNIYLLADWEFGEQLSDRYIWVKKNFGSLTAEKLIFTCDKNRSLLPKSQRDLLIDCDLSNIEKWIHAGGSGYWWPELHWSCPDRAKLLTKRMELVRNVVHTLEK